MIHYRNLYEDEIELGLFKNFIRHQVVQKCWRKENGKWIVKDAPFIDDWAERDYRELITHLKNTIASGGFVYAAFQNNRLKGFVSVENEFLDEYLDLSNIHVSEDMRNCGIGTALFTEAAKWAKKHGATKLYISAHSAIESQAFYKKCKSNFRMANFLLPSTLLLHLCNAYAHTNSHIIQVEHM